MIFRFDTISSEPQIEIFSSRNKLFQKFIWKVNFHRISKIILKEYLISKFTIKERKDGYYGTAIRTDAYTNEI